MKKRLIIFSDLLPGPGLTLSTVNSRENPLPAGVVADKVLVEKRERRLTLFKKRQILKGGSRPESGGEEGGGGGQEYAGRDVRDRPAQGTQQLPPRDSHQLPNADDVAKAQARGVSPGGDVMIHGLPNALGFVGKLHVSMDRALGCIAVTNPEIEEIWRAVPDGTAVEIVP